MARKLGVLAGGGPLPAEVIAAAASAGRAVFVVAFEGETDPAAIAGAAHQWVPLGAVGRTLRLLHEAGAEDVVMIGPVRRPSLSSLKLDWRGLQLVSSLGLPGRGDDRLFKVIVGELEREGFRVVGADEVVGDLVAPAGVMTRTHPNDDARADIRIGVRVAARLGDLDVGQAVVVEHGLVLGVEAIEGTDRLLARCADLRRSERGGVLVKLKKPGQERRADLPTVGPQTVRGAIAAGLDGIAVHAGHCLMIDRPQLLELADRAGRFVVGVAADAEACP